jgi:hypothetical protein
MPGSGAKCSSWQQFERRCVVALELIQQKSRLLGLDTMSLMILTMKSNRHDTRNNNECCN